MTLKGHKAHFNVKFLKSYGHSISVKNSKIILKDNHDPFSKPTSEEWFVKNMPYSKIILSGKGYISTEALSVVRISDLVYITIIPDLGIVSFLLLNMKKPKKNTHSEN